MPRNLHKQQRIVGYMLPFKVEPFLYVPNQGFVELESMRRKLTLRVGLVRQIAKSSEVAVKKILRTAAFNTCSLYC